jgi:hypothetical protein
MSIAFLETAPHAKYTGKRQDTSDGGHSAMLELSQSRVYDYALNILDAYKLSGNFTVDLEIVLKDLGVFGDVTFAIKPKSFLSDCRHVEFFPKARAHRARFVRVVRTIESCVGYEPGLWQRLFPNRVRTHETEVS